MKLRNGVAIKTIQRAQSIAPLQTLNFEPETRNLQTSQAQKRETRNSEAKNPETALAIETAQRETPQA